MDPLREMSRQISRRAFLGSASTGLGATALSWLMSGEAGATPSRRSGLSGLPHFAPRARRVIFLFQFGGPSQFETFDYKPHLTRMHGKELPASVRGDAPLSGLTRNQKGLPIVKPFTKFAPRGASGMWVSDQMPHTAQVADDLCVIRSMTCDIVAHDPALRFIQTGAQMAGKPSAGSWITYGLGSESRDLPSYVVLISNGRGAKDTQPLAARLWGNAFLPSLNQGVQFRSTGDPVLFLSDPPGIDRSRRKAMLDAVTRLNELRSKVVGDPEIDARIGQYELAFRMQKSVPNLLDLSREPRKTVDLYGPDARTPGTYAANCLLARRMAERGVRFIQLFHRGWDQHGDLPRALSLQCRDTDQPTAALIKDLKQRGLLEDTLIVWGGEFGRTAYCQGKLAEGNYGRDHHGRAFSMFLAGGGVRGGLTYGETDDLGYNIVKNPVHIRDLHATILHCLGIDHHRLTFKFQGLEHRLTGVEEAHVVRPILA